MPDYTNWAIANQAVMNPATSAADLTQIANAQPSLRAAVAAHPSAHPQLLDWLAHQGDPSVAAAVAARRAGYQAPAPAPAPVGFAPAPGYAPMPAAGGSGGMSRNMMIGLILGGVALIVAVALILVFAIFRLGGNSGSSDFDSAQAQYAQSQAAMASALSKAKDVAASADEGFMDDSSLLKNLQADIKKAEDYSPIVLTKASDKSAVQAQVSQLQAETSRVDTLKSNLNNDVKAVQASQLSWAKTALSDAIAEAENVYDAPQGSNDPQTLTDLWAAIEAAQATLKSLDGADPSTVVNTTIDAIQKLLDAEAAVKQTRTLPCDVSLPEGIDPMVCGGMPSDALQMPWTSWGGNMSTQMFVSADGDVGCMWFDDRVECGVKDATWRMPADLMQSDVCITSQNCGGPSIALMSDGTVTAWPRSDVPDVDIARMEGAKVPVLMYGQTAAFGGVACYADVPGTTCWDTSTHHGFQISTGSLLYW